MEAKPKGEHLLALKVMRLTRPTLANPVVVTCDSTDLPGNTLNNELKNDCTALQGMETLAVGQFMVLPQSFGNIYLGEIFSSYLCVHNGSNQLVKNVTVKADLQTSTQIISLSGNSGGMKDLAPDSTVDEVIHHEVKEIGTHILVCEVTYTSSNIGATSESFRKYYRLQVVKPLDVKTKFYNAESDEVYLEAQIQNLTAGPICLEKVSLESSHLFSVSTLNTNKKGESIYGSVNVLDTDCSRQYLYCLKPQLTLLKDLKMMHNATNIGKLDIVWRSNLGERGRLQTSQLQRMAPEYGDLRVTMKDIPLKVYLEQPVHFNCHIINTSERSMDLMLSLDSSSSIAWCGISNTKIGTLKSGASIDIPLCLIALHSGIITISGLKLEDTFLKRTYDYDDLAQIFVNQID
ncbi:trafficking protein particle complex subunit 13 isoform X2 [Hylaeus anthracinus]|uniref:trafficking protein particle complex subunit 13 isoform X2 n=1 Tax=Hylaeus volcanicus TaxID=313075 RepID=UPI0023B8770E|nr:trafficking protein particle complex subunit 13 isoform X2 [Hylaeus volcanicus]XP_053999565.1 trafficking protein particle complex subunit 13 isoform X2 [Hylaeus anthracinus]